MAKFCSKCEGYIICDFCKHYDWGSGDVKKGSYAGDGKCKLTGKRKEPENGCNKFVCFNIKKEAKKKKGKK